LSKVIYTTGLSGFIGQSVVKKIISEYDVIVNFGRDKKISIYQSSLNPIYKDFNLDELEIFKSDSLIHLAGYYNPMPTSLFEELLLKESNFNFPFSLCSLLKKNGLKRVFSTSSYMQLLDLKNQNVYSETKSKFINWAKSEFEVTEIFLFDTFGPNDKRNKVMDVFIRKAILNQDINIPSCKIDINLTHVDEVASAIVSATKLSKGQYMIMSKNNTTIEDLAKNIISLNKTSTKIKTKFEGNNFFESINSFPKNIYLKTLEIDFHEQIQERYNEIKQTHCF
jgi:nucleoside-diphosphate-sugar epimerase